jgi:hypothetical protein
MPILVFVPILPKVFLVSSKKSCVGKILKSIWAKRYYYLHFEDVGIRFTQLSLCSLVGDLQKTSMSI